MIDPKIRPSAELPSDPLTCLRLASAMILATVAAPDHPLVPSAHDLATTAAIIHQLIARGLVDAELRPRAHALARSWAGEARRLGLRRRSRRRYRRARKGGRTHG